MPALASLAVALATAGPLVGVVDQAGHAGSLARLDPVTLTRTSAAVKLDGYIWGYGRSPDRSALAVGVSRRKAFALQIVDLRRWRTLRSIRLASPASLVSWPRPDRVVAMSAWGFGATAVVADPGTGRIVQRIALPGETRDAHRTATGIAVLSSPRRRIGHAHLTTVDAEGRVRTQVLGDIRAGFLPPPSNTLRAGEVPISHSVSPALAVDESGGRAFVVGAGRPVVDEVDLATGAVRRHVIVSSTPASARAAKAEEGMNRFAQWMGAGRLAVTGYDAYLTHDDRQRMIPFGVQVMDTTTWRARTLASRATWFVPAAPGYLLWPGRSQGGGMATYSLATGRRTHRFGHASVGSMTWGGRYVYATVRGRHRTYVIDPASGRTVRVLKTGRTPRLLVD